MNVWNFLNLKIYAGTYETTELMYLQLNEYLNNKKTKYVLLSLFYVLLDIIFKKLMYLSDCFKILNKYIIFKRSFPAYELIN